MTRQGPSICEADARALSKSSPEGRVSHTDPANMIKTYYTTPFLFYLFQTYLIPDIKQQENNPIKTCQQYATKAGYKVCFVTSPNNCYIKTSQNRQQVQFSNMRSNNPIKTLQLHRQLIVSAVPNTLHPH